VHAIKAYIWRSGSIAPLIFNFSNNEGERSGSCLCHHYSLNMRLGRPSGQFGHFGRQKNLLPLPQIKHGKTQNSIMFEIS
jgi:hypothetical protein